MDWALTLNLLGTFFFAVSGSLLAARRGYDIIGSLLLGSLTGLGGGIIRDLILGVPPIALAEPIYLLPPVLAMVLVYFLKASIVRFSRLLLVFDAGGLALFATTGTIAALSAGLTPVSAAILGVVTGVGGGLLRDVVANRDPQVFTPSDLYAIPAMLGAGLVTLLWETGHLTVITELCVALVVFGLRILSLRFRWHAPNATRRPTRPDAGR